MSSHNYENHNHKPGSLDKQKPLYDSPTVFANNVPVATFKAPQGSASVTVNGIITTYQFPAGDSLEDENLRPLVNETGRFGLTDEEGETPVTVDKYGQEIGGTDSLSQTSSDSITSTNNTAATGTPNISAPSGDDVYSVQLSPSFIVNNFTLTALYPHPLTEQQGLSFDDLVSNLTALAVNVAEPLLAQYPGYRINSGFREGSGTSQHTKGQAMDIQWPGISSAEYLTRTNWILDNIAYDQIIFEHGNSIWLHISHNRTSNRYLQTTMHNNNYTAGITNFYG